MMFVRLQQKLGKIAFFIRLTVWPIMERHFLAHDFSYKFVWVLFLVTQTEPADKRNNVPNSHPLRTKEVDYEVWAGPEIYLSIEFEQHLLKIWGNSCCGWEVRNRLVWSFKLEVNEFEQHPDCLERNTAESSREESRGLTMALWLADGGRGKKTVWCNWKSALTVRKAGEEQKERNRMNE